MFQHDLLALAMLVLVLGIKHGFDADHLATIDGLTRYNAQANPRLSRYCGVLFSLGHGSVVIIIALLVSTWAQHWAVPAWLSAFGSWVSIAFLIGLGWLNLNAVLHTKASEMVQAVGLKSALVTRYTQVAHPLWVAAVGVLFAFSFDTMSQAAMFSIMATPVGGWQFALLLGGLFTVGMLVTDGLNGLWIARLIRRADYTARLASRIMSLTIAWVSLLVAFLSIMRMLFPTVDMWSEGRALLFGILVMALIASGFIVAIWMSKARPADI